MGLLLEASKRSTSPEVLATARDDHRYEGIADTFVQLFSFCVAVLIAMPMTGANSTAVLRWAAKAAGNRRQLKRRPHVDSSDFHGQLEKLAARTALSQRIWPD